MQRTRRWVGFACITLAIISLNGCSSTPVKLNRQRIAENPISQIDLLVRQETLEPENSVAGFEAGSGAFAVLGAIVGSAIDAGINAKRNKSFKAIKEGAASIDFNSHFVGQLKRETKSNAFANPVSVRLVDDNDIAQNIPLLVLRYYISDNFRFVVVTADVSYRQSDPTDSVFARTYSSIQTADDVEALSDDKTANVEFWSNNIPLLTSLVEEGMSDVARKFGRDFSGQ